MLNIFGALGAVSRLLPNYLEGQRMAVQDNWRDLQQYNQAQAGQLQNLAMERTLPWYFNMYADAANQSRINTLLGLNRAAPEFVKGPTNMEMALRYSEMAPDIYSQSLINTQQQQQGQNLLYPDEFAARRRALNQVGTNALGAGGLDSLTGGDNMYNRVFQQPKPTAAQQ